MGQASTIGSDIAKHIFQAHGADASGRVVFRKRLARAKVVPFFAAQAPCGRCCTDQGCGRSCPSPVCSQAVRTEIGRPNSSMRLSAWTATSTSVARRSSVRERSPSPITCLNLPTAASTKARFV